MAGSPDRNRDRVRPDLAGRKVLATMSELIITKAKHAGSCCICGGSIYTGDEIYLGTSHGIPTAAHSKCGMLYPEVALDTFDQEDGPL